MKSTVQKAAGGVALGWVPLDFIFAFCLPFFVGADISCSCVGQSMMKIIFVARNRSFLGTYMVQLTCFEWKLSHLSPAFCIWHRWRNTRFRAIYFDIRVPNLTCHQHRENTLCSANSIGSFTNFQLLVSCNGPSIPNLKMKFFYPIFGFPFSWLKLGNPLHSFLILSTGKIWKFTLLPNLTCHQHRGNKLSSANSIGSFTNFQLLVSCNGPSIPNLKMKFFYPIFGFLFSWLKPWEPLKFISDFIHRKDLKVHPVTKLDMPPTQGKQTVLCQQHWQLHQLQLLVSCNGPSIPNLKMKFFYPIFGFPFSWLKLGNPLNSFLILSTGKIWKFTLLPNLTCHQHRENTLSSANSNGSFTNFQLLVSCFGPSIPNLKMKFFYPIFGFLFSWLKLGNPLNSFLILSTGKIWKFTLLPNLTCHQHRENKLSSANSIRSFT